MHHVAVYAEFRRDWPEALKFYEEGIRGLREVHWSKWNQ
uniref:Uncharacterized protein n=1 Tax=Arundo donax TaxID=35708 RepID=A0A0A9DPP4_ARUDO